MENIEVNKNNIQDVINEILKEKKIKYVNDYSSNTECGYELYIGSESGYIYIEYDLENESDNEMCIKFHSEIDDSGLSIYSSEIDNYKEKLDSDGIEIEINELHTNIKIINSVIAKIENKINQIRDLCEENQLEFDNFIQVLYNFD